MRMHAFIAIAALGLLLASGCAAPSADSASTASQTRIESQSASDASSASTQMDDEPNADERFFNENVPYASERGRALVPLQWNIDNTFIVGHQGTTSFWGSCGQCCIANTLNLVTGSAYTEADIVDYVSDRGWCDPSTGGMTMDDMAQAYYNLLPSGSMGVYGYGGDYAPTIEEMATRLDNGIILNVSVYGEMMREGGHIDEGEVASTHWIVVYGVSRNEDGSLAGFDIIDSASDISYLTAQELADFYYGHDGTTIADPTCMQVYGWKPSR